MPEKFTGLPPLPALQAFEAAARNENFMAAADELHLSQSAISHRVRALEHHLGYALFERLPRGLRLTENGKAYLPSVRSAFAEILGATTSIFGARHSGRLTIRAPLSYAAIWLPDLVSEFSQSYPDIEVRLNSSVWTDRLAADETDIELRLGCGHWPGYKAELLFQETLIPLCSDSAFSQLPNTVSARVLANQPLIHVTGVEDQWGEFFRQNGVVGEAQHKRKSVLTDSSVAAASLSATGSHLCLLTETLAAHFLDLGVLVRAAPLSVPSKQGLYLVTPETSSALVPEVELFRGMLIKRCASLTRPSYQT